MSKRTARKPQRTMMQGKDVRAGDVIVNYAGVPVFRVEDVTNAKARGYLVFLGRALVKVEGSSRTYHMHRDDEALVERCAPRARGRSGLETLWSAAVDSVRNKRNKRSAR